LKFVKDIKDRNFAPTYKALQMKAISVNDVLDPATGQTIMHLVCQHCPNSSDARIWSKLLSFNPDPNVLDSEGNTPYHTAVFFANDIACYFLQMIPEVDRHALTTNDETAMHLAVRSMDKRMIIRVCKNNICPFSFNAQGEDCLQLCNEFCFDADDDRRNLLVQCRDRWIGKWGWPCILELIALLKQFCNDKRKEADLPPINIRPTREELQVVNQAVFEGATSLSNLILVIRNGFPLDLPITEACESLRDLLPRLKENPSYPKLMRAVNKEQRRFRSFKSLGELLESHLDGELQNRSLMTLKDTNNMTLNLSDYSITVSNE
jgi:hypothetical protein